LAIKTNLAVVYGEGRMPVEFATVINGKLDEDGFRACFASYPVHVQINLEATAMPSDQLLAERKVFIIGKNGGKTYVSFAFGFSPPFVAELAHTIQTLRVLVKAQTRDFLSLIEANAEFLFASK
jgi:hypothetical protein